MSGHDKKLSLWERSPVLGGAVVSKSYLPVVEIHDAAGIQTLTSLVAANQLAAGAFFGENGHP